MISMRKYWQHKGSIFGKCHSIDHDKWFWVNIPKNASSFTQTLLAHQLLWYEHNFYEQDLSDRTALAVLRDPVERWISGISEYISLYHGKFDAKSCDPQMLEWIFDRVTFDDHTEKQIYFVDGLDHKKTVWFWCDHSYKSKLISWLEKTELVDWPFVVPKCVYELENKNDRSLLKIQVKSYFSNILKQEKKYHDRLIEYFQDDYDLIKRIKFI